MNFYHRATVSGGCLHAQPKRQQSDKGRFCLKNGNRALQPLGILGIFGKFWEQSACRAYADRRSGEMYDFYKADDLHFIFIKSILLSGIVKRKK